MIRVLPTLSPNSLADDSNRTDKTRSNAYPVSGFYDRLALGLQVFDSAQCGSIPVPPLNLTTQSP